MLRNSFITWFQWLLFSCCWMLPQVVTAQVNQLPKADSLYERAVELSRTSAYDKSLEAHLKAVRIYEASGHPPGLSKSYNSIGLLYDKLKKYEISRKYFDKALAELKRSPDEGMRSKVLNNLGMLQESLRHPDSALFFYQSSLKLKQKTGDYSGMAKIYNNIGGLRLTEKKYRDALDNYFQSLQIKQQLHDSAGLARAYSNIANCYGWLGLFDSVGYYLVQGRNYLKNEPDLTLHSLYYHNFSALYRAKGDFKRAYLYLDSSDALSEKVFSKELASELERHEVLFETEKKDSEIKRQKLRNRLLNETENRQRREKIIYLILCLVLSLGLISFYYFKKNKSQKAGLRLLVLEQERQLNEITLQKAQQQQELMAKEIELKAKELAGSSTLNLQKQELIIRLKEQLAKFRQENAGFSTELLGAIDSTFRQYANIDEEWSRFRIHFESVHASFFDSLTTFCPALTETDLRHCAYMKIGLTTKEIASLLNISPASVQKSRVRLKKKLNIDEDLYEFIRQL